MDRLSVTTSFGRRPASLALVKEQIRAREIEAGKSVEKWKIHREVCDARSLLGVQDRALAVLYALLSFYPGTMLEEGADLVVFPSNAQLTIRSNGISGSTLRRSLLALVEAGLITRRDSPNGKRYARKDVQGRIETAYGFDLSPLLARSEEIAAKAQEVAAEKRRLQVAKERVSLCRRDLRKFIAVATQEGVSGNWTNVETTLNNILARMPRNAAAEDMAAAAEDLSMLHEEAVNLLEAHEKLTKKTGNDSHIDRHIQNSNTESSNETEPAFDKKQSEKSTLRLKTDTGDLKVFPLEMVLRACPEVVPFGPGGTIKTWRDLMAAAVTVRSMLGVSPSAYEAACEAMGETAAATVMACIYEKSGHINSAGGYLRDLTARTQRGEFSIGPMLMALLRGQEQAGRAA